MRGWLTFDGSVFFARSRDRLSFGGMRISVHSARLHRAALPLACALSSYAFAEREAVAYERQWHVGLEGGYALAAFPDASTSGFDVGLHGSYGVSDAFNVRAHANVSAFDLPAPQMSALFVSGGVGAEYIVDILRWVPYVGATLGPNVMRLQNGPTVLRLGIEIPAGLGYQLTRNWTIGAEVRYRLLVLGESELSPTHGFVGLARAEFAWGS